MRIVKVVLFTALLEANLMSFFYTGNYNFAITFVYLCNFILLSNEISRYVACIRYAEHLERYEQLTKKQ